MDDVSAYLRLRCVESGDCLRWYTKANTEQRKRHPMLRLPGESKPVLARRALYEAERGPIREGYYLMPHCGDECCIEPSHQKQVTQRQMVTIGAKKASTSKTRGPNVREAMYRLGRLKLTPELVREIRASNETGKALADRLGVSNKSVCEARTYKTWCDNTDNPFAGLIG